LVSLIESKRQQEKKSKFFLYAYTLGKEELFFNLAAHFQTKVVMLKDRLKRMEAIDMAKPHFICIGEREQDQECFIYVKPMKDLPKTQEECEKKKNTHFVVLTGWNKQYNLNHPRYHKIPYSSHSNWRELEEFVKELRPKRIFFNTKEKSGGLEKARSEFQKKLVGYTEEGKDLKP